jgi:4-hydroxythreonine-4-phosphate dehydrogenase
VVGSRAAESRAQRAWLTRHGVRHVVLDGPDEDMVARVREALLTGPVLLSPDPDLPVVADQAPRIARRLAAAAVGALDRAGTLVLTGGETARAVLGAAGVTRLVVLGEVAPGVVRSHAPPLGLDVVTKAGAFGGPDTLLRCLSGQHPEDEGVKP